MLDILYHFCH